MADAALYESSRAQVAALRDQLRTATTPTAKLAAATTLLRILGTAAANAPTPELRERWLTQYRALQPMAATLRAQVTDAAPGVVLRELDKFSDAVLGFGGQVLEGAGGVIAAAPKVLGLLTTWGPILLVGVVVLLVVYYGKRYKVALSKAGK